MTTDNYQNALDALSGALLEVDRQKATIASLCAENEHLANVAMGTAMALGMVGADRAFKPGPRCPDCDDHTLTERDRACPDCGGVRCGICCSWRLTSIANGWRCKHMMPKEHVCPECVAEADLGKRGGR